MRVVITVASARSLFCLPIAAAFGALAGLGLGSALNGALIGAKIIVAAIALQQWSFANLAGARDVSRSRRDFGHMLTLGGLFLGFGTSATAFIRLPIADPLSAPAAALMFGAGWLAMRLDEWHFHHTTCDLVTPVRRAAAPR